MNHDPHDDHELIQEWMDDNGLSCVDIHIEGADDEATITCPGAMTDEVKEAAIRLTRAIADTKMDDWTAGEGSTGHVRYMPGEDPWLDASADEEDWSYERDIDLDDIEYDEEPDDEPEDGDEIEP